MYKKLSLVIVFVLLASVARSQENSASSTEFLPDIDGIIKVKTEFDLNNSKMRFEVRNARFGAKGKVNKVISYRVEVDLSDEGKIKMLDAFVRFTPLKNLDFYMGQRKIPFSTDYIRNPAENFFANRSFVAKYVNDGMRDIGFYADYKFDKVPVQVIVGAVNGTGNNNPQWIDRPNFVSRLLIGKETGFRITSNIYQGAMGDRNKLLMTGWELRYASGPLLLESEIVTRAWDDTLSVRRKDAGIYLHSYYNFVTTNNIFRIITPTLRWDRMGDKIFSDDYSADRITMGVNFCFEPKQFMAEMRLNYENYLRGYLPTHTDKFTIEFIARF
ncbi:MAG: porin [Bacteroidales bacterium]